MSVYILQKGLMEQRESHILKLQEEFNLKTGDLIVITGGFPLGQTRMTNYIRIVEI